MPIRTLDPDKFADKVGNVYEATVILSKRARQIALHTKTELDQRLSYFEDFSLEPEEMRANEDQMRISLEYERKPKPTESAIGELLDDEIYYRHSGSEE